MSSSDPSHGATKHAHGVTVEPKIAVEWHGDDECQMVAEHDEIREHCDREADYLVAFELDTRPGEPENVLSCGLCWPNLHDLIVEHQGFDAEDGGEA